VGAAGGLLTGIILSRLFDEWIRDADAQRQFEAWVDAVRDQGAEWPPKQEQEEQP
jgi:transposase